MNGIWIFPVFLSLLAGGCGGCGSSAPPLGADPTEPREAQPKLQTIKLYLGTNELNAELALTPLQERTGMMFRTNMEENAGMLFVFPAPHLASFWMKNCPLPLSIAYLDSEGIIQEIHDMEPHNTNSISSQSENIRYALETSQGWFKRHQVNPGMAVGTDRGTLQQTFFNRSGSR